mgnify:CR=1 FL=1
MSSVINLNQASLYGFITQWGDAAFSGAIRVGNWGSQQGVFAQNYNYTTTTTNTWGTKQYHNHSGTAYPDSTLNASQDASQPTISGGNAQGGLSVSNPQWSGASTSNYSPYLNLYTLLAPLSGSNTSSSMSVVTPYDYNVIGAPGGSYTGNSKSYTSYGQPAFTVTNGVNDSSVIYQTVNGSALSISEGQITTSVQNLADGKDLNVSFTFEPGASSVFSISSNFTQSVRSSDTQGTSQSNSTSGSNTASFGITASETGTVGVDPSNQVSETLQASYSDAWETAWSNTSTADFSSTNAISSTSSFTFTTTENLNNAIITGYQTTANGNQTPLYQYTTTFTDPTTGQTTTTTSDLIAGGVYEWTLQYYAGTIQNIASGQYTLSGNTGSIADSSGNTFGGNIAQAFYYANQGNAWDALGYDYNPVVSFNSGNPADITSVTINGSTVSSTNESVNLYLGLAAVSSVSSSSSSTASSLSSALKSSSPGDGRSSLAKGKWLNIVDGLLVLPEKTRNPTAYYGDNSVNSVRDTLGQDLIQAGGGNDRVLLRGNSVQSNNAGDIVNLGSGSDIADARRAVGANSILADTGDDQVFDGSSNLMVDLGSGNDSYTYGGGDDIISLGAGADRLDLKRGSGSVVVGDFVVGEDVVTGLGKKASLVWDDSISGFVITNSDRVTGKLFTASASSSAQGPEFWYGLALQNVQALKLDDSSWNGSTWQDVRARYGRYAYGQPNLKTEDWASFSQSRTNVNNAAEFIAQSAGVSSLSKHDLNQINRLAGVSDGFTEFIAATTGYVTGL